MNLSLLLFAIPISTIILSVVWQRIINNPFLVASTAFAIFFVIVYAIDPGLLIYAIIYTLLSFLASSISKFLFEHCHQHSQNSVIENIQSENLEVTTLNSNSLNANALNTGSLNTNALNLDNSNYSSCNNRFPTNCRKF